MNVVELFLLLGIVAFAALWRWGGHLLVWLEGVERSLDPVHEPDPVCTVEDEWFDADEVVEPEDVRTAAVIRQRLDVEMRRRGHRGRR